jgi:thioesterase domain-containing protein
MGYLQLARHLGTNRPFYGVQSLGIDGRDTPLESIEAMAAFYLDAIRATQPHGPYHLGGHSLGGRVAFEMTRQLEAAGETVGLLAIVDVGGLGDEELEVPDDTAALAHLVSQLEDHYGVSLDVTLVALTPLDPDARYDLVLSRLTERRLLPPGAGREEAKGFLRVYQANMRAINRYRLTPCTTDITLLATDELRTKYDPATAMGWQPLTTGRVHILPVPGDHMSLLKEPNVAAVAARLTECLDRT